MPELIDSYFTDFKAALDAFLAQGENVRRLHKGVEILRATRDSGATIYLIGNGGSAAVAEHMAIDLTKNAGLKAIAFSSACTLTTLANDYGYERAFEKAVDAYGREGDVLIAISSGGTSPNILNACRAARAHGMKVIALSGFEADNPLRALGDVDLWVDSRAYGYVELLHNLLIHYMNDAIIGSAEYVIR